MTNIVAVSVDLVHQSDSVIWELSNRFVFYLLSFNFLRLLACCCNQVLNNYNKSIEIFLKSGKAYCCWKQVELNTIASGFGWLGPASGMIHRLVINPDPDPGN